MDTSPNIPPPPTPFDDESPKKYIRTFAGDMEIIKKGGIPDLKPLEPVLPAQAKESPPAKAPAPPPVKPPPPLPPPVKPLEPSQTVLPEEHKPFPLETYTGDFLQKIKDKQASTVTVLAAEQDAGTSENTPEKPPHRNTIAIVVSVVLLIVGGSAAYIAYTHYLANSQPIAIAPTISAPIFFDDKERIYGETPDAILKAITLSMTHTLTPNAIRLLYTDIATTTGNSIFSALQLPAPDILLRNINAAQTMAGIVNINGTQSPFFILSVASYPNTFAGMLSWESTMPSDFGALFPPHPLATSTEVTIVTTTQKTKVKTATSTPLVPVFSASFHDEVVSNHDVRVYRDAGGRSVLMYGYWNKATLVVARDPSAFTEILRRLATSYTQ